jgi:hypothetical protein
VQAMDQKTKSWLLGTCSKHYWRVAAYYDLDDLIQEGMLVYHRTEVRYNEEGRHAEQKRNKSHSYMVSTFKRSFINHIHDLANKRSRQPLELQIIDQPVPDDDVGRRNWLDYHGPSTPETQTFCAMVSMAPLRIREVLALFNSDDNRKRLRAQYRIRPDGSRESLNERLCRLAGFDPECVDLVRQLQLYFSD